jgi:hypothetical protein
MFRDGATFFGDLGLKYESTVRVEQFVARRLLFGVVVSDSGLVATLCHELRRGVGFSGVFPPKFDSSSQLDSR